MLLSSNLKETKSKEVEKTLLLLENPDEKKTLDFMRHMSPNGVFAKNEELVALKKEKDSFTQKYSTAFSRSEINRECRKFNLALIQAGEYTGEYGIDYIKNLNEYVESKGIALSGRDLARGLYLLVPAESDTASKRCLDGLKNPLVFYYESVNGENGTDYFMLIDGRRNYVTLLNAWKGFKNLSISNTRWAYIIENILGLSALSVAFLFFGINIFFSIPIITLIISFIAIIGMFIRCGLRSSLISDFKHQREYFNIEKYKV